MHHIPAVERFLKSNYSSEHSLTPGEALLGAFLVGHWESSRQIVKAPDFFIPHERRLYEAMQAIADSDRNTVPDVMLVSQHLRADSYWNMLRLARLMEEAPIAQNLTVYARRLKDANTAVQIIESVVNLVQGLQVMQDPQEALKRHLFAMGALACESPSGKDKLVFLADAIDESLALLEARIRGEAIAIIRTGWERLDRDLPLSRGDLLILAGRPAMGKTSAILNMITQMMRTQEEIIGLFVSLEMRTDQLVFKLLASEAHVEKSKLRHPEQLTATELDNLVDAARDLHAVAGNRLALSERRGMRVEDMSVDIARVRAARGRCDFVVVDYLQLLQTAEKSKDLYHKTTAISGVLKTIALKEDVLVICLAQLNRDAAKPNHAAGPDAGSRLPEMDHLRDSGAIEQDADSIVMIHRKDYYEQKPNDYNLTSYRYEDNTERTHFLIRKNRHGEEQRIQIDFSYDQKTGRLVPI